MRLATLELQPKILRALQEKAFERVGGTRSIPVNAKMSNENFIERSVILTQGSVLRAPLFELEMPRETVESQGARLEVAEREHILRVLREAKGMIGGRRGAAERLGLKQRSIRRSKSWESGDETTFSP